MNLFSVTLVGAAMWLGVANRLPGRWPPLIGAGVAAIVWQPALLLAAPLVALAVALHRFRKSTVDKADGDLTLLGDLLSLGLSAGLSLGQALARAGEAVGGEVGDEVKRLLRQGRERGLAEVLQSSEGRARRLYLQVGRAVATGAPLGPAVRAFVADRRNQDRADRLTRARKLPVRLLLPLALLILPGFVILTIGPTLLGSLERLQVSLPTVVGR